MHTYIYIFIGRSHVGQYIGGRGATIEQQMVRQHTMGYCWVVNVESLYMLSCAILGSSASSDSESPELYSLCSTCDTKTARLKSLLQIRNVLTIEHKYLYTRIRFDQRMWLRIAPRRGGAGALRSHRIPSDDRWYHSILRRCPCVRRIEFRVHVEKVRQKANDIFYISISRYRLQTLNLDTVFLRDAPISLSVSAVSRTSSTSMFEAVQGTS